MFSYSILKVTMSKRRLEETGIGSDDDNESDLESVESSDSSVEEDHSSDENLSSSGDEDEDEISDDELDDSQSNDRYDILNPSAETNDWVLVDKFEDLLDFDGDDQMTANFDPKQSPVDYFRMFFTSEMKELLIAETNKYAKTKLKSDKTRKKQSKKRKQSNWKDVDSDDTSVINGGTDYFFV